jgi:CMP-N-acetylneuraminic acid synthetase
MKTLCVIPIKSKSERLPGKNLRFLYDKPLYQWTFDTIINCGFDRIVVDTDSNEVADAAREMGFEVLQRNPALASNAATGNDLMMDHLVRLGVPDIYVQRLITSPFLRTETIKLCVNFVRNDVDSAFTVVERQGYFWNKCRPTNYDLDKLPNSASLPTWCEETTGLYCIRGMVAKSLGRRIGNAPVLVPVSLVEAIDINLLNDWNLAEIVADSNWWHKEAIRRGVQTR